MATISGLSIVFILFNIFLIHSIVYAIKSITGKQQQVQILLYIRHQQVHHSTIMQGSLNDRDVLLKRDLMSVSTMVSMYRAVPARGAQSIVFTSAALVHQWFGM